jgi:hypothetical protein
VAKLLRRIAVALLLWLLIVLAIGTAVRLRLERRTVYIGDVRALAPDPLPLDVGHARAAVRDARHYEQQVG